MAVTNQMLLEELQRLQARVNELSAAIALLCERAAGLEMWRDGHDGNVHPRLREQIRDASDDRLRQGNRLWNLALQVATLVALLANAVRMADAW